MVFALLCMAVLHAPHSLANTPKILIVGDSLSAEYGLPRGTGWVSLLDKRLSYPQSSWSLINASISGETTAGGQARLATLLKTHQPQIVIIELGANDALRGLQLQTTEKNLRQMIQASKKSGARVLLLGMRIPPNYGADYSNQFFRLFAKLAESEQIEYVPFFLEKVADKVELFQADRIHPNTGAQSILLENIWPKLQPMLKP
jgi:acyl-CoA thioesterase-1